MTVIYRYRQGYNARRLANKAVLAEQAAEEARAEGERAERARHRPLAPSEGGVDAAED